MRELAFLSCSRSVSRLSCDNLVESVLLLPHLCRDLGSVTRACVASWRFFLSTFNLLGAALLRQRKRKPLLRKTAKQVERQLRRAALQHQPEARGLLRMPVPMGSVTLNFLCPTLLCCPDQQTLQQRMLIGAYDCSSVQNLKANRISIPATLT